MPLSPGKVCEVSPTIFWCLGLGFGIFTMSRQRMGWSVLVLLSTEPNKHYWTFTKTWLNILTAALHFSTRCPRNIFFGEEAVTVVIYILTRISLWWGAMGVDSRGNILSRCDDILDHSFLSLPTTESRDEWLTIMNVWKESTLQCVLCLCLLANRTCLC